MRVVRPSQRVGSFADSMFGEMTRLAEQHGAVNLSQGFPDFPAPPALKEAACAAIRGDVNQYAASWGTPPLRDAIARIFTRRSGVPVSADEQVTVCCGSTEAMMAVMLGCVDPGDEVIVFEPFYENYGPDAIVAGARPRFVRLRGPDWRFDPGELAHAFSNRTRAIVINTPGNPTGKVFTRDELQSIADLCQRWGVLAIADEIYERLVYDGHTHVSIASLPGMAERTVTVSGLSKTYSVTGWRVGWAIAPSALSGAIRKVHDFLTVAAPAPLQDAGVMALSLPERYYSELAAGYQRKRDALLAILERHGFASVAPGGAYYIMSDVSGFGFASDVAFARHLVTEVGVAVMPGSSFYLDPGDGASHVRFCFSKTDETLREVDRRLEGLKS